MNLFSELCIKEVTLRNRIVVPPMCTYSADQGEVNEFHLSHIGALARGGAGLVIVEATAVSAEGRITPRCLGIWSDSLAKPFRSIVQAIKCGGAVPGIQLAHAGRKASSALPWEGDNHLTDSEGGWPTIAPSPIAFGEKLGKTPKEMSLDDIQRVQSHFVRAAERALDVGFEWLQLHFAHGYLAQSFFCSESNLRTDEYGGSLANRARFMLETIRQIRVLWPNKYPLTVRLGVTDFGADHVNSINESLWLSKQFESLGVDLIDVSMRFNTPTVTIPRKAAVLREIAHQFKESLGIPVSVAWGLGEPELANDIIESGDADLIAVGKKHLENPHWPYFAAQMLGQDLNILPEQYSFWLSKAK